MPRTVRGLTALVGGTALTLAALSLTASQSSAATPVQHTQPVSRAAVPAATAAPAHPAVERLCSTPTRAHQMACMALRQVTPNEPSAIRPDSVSPASTPAGYGPSSLASAYALNTGGGSGQTVGIVDAQDDPNAESDLAAYRTQYGLPACTTANGCFRKVNQTGGTSYPTADSGWAGEISLDLDMVSAVCPNCHILLVEATSATDADLGTAVNEAVALGAKFVSNSYGGNEDSSVTSAEASYYKHPGVAITASAGDSDYGAEFPATSQYVTAVGGTSLTTSSNARGWSETVWKTSSTEGTGSGCSAYISKPSFQTGITTDCSKRAEADVSAVADPATGVAVYDTYGASGWNVYGGTSAASPIVASVYALAGTPGSSDYPNAYPYAHAGNLNDVTSGNNGSCSPNTVLCTAGTGWDGPTGLGTPDGTAAFTAGGTTPTGVTVANPGSRTGTVGTAVSLQLSASGGTSPYTWTATGLPTGLSISSAGLISGTPSAAGTFSITATAKDSAARTGSATFSWTISTAGTGCSGQKFGNPGFESGNTVWAATSGVITDDTSAPAHSGSYYAWLDGYGTTHTDTLSQSVTIPSGCKATLTYYLYITTDETGSTAYDTLKVTAGSTTVASYSNVNAGSGYVLRTVSLNSYAGTTVKLTFTGSEDSSLQTSFLIDDTAVTLS